MYLKNKNIASVILCQMTHFMQREIKSKRTKKTKRIGSKNSFESNTWVNEIVLNP